MTLSTVALSNVLLACILIANLLTLLVVYKIKRKP
jgi:hypothetical protein